LYSMAPMFGCFGSMNRIAKVAGRVPQRLGNISVAAVSAPSGQVVSTDQCLRHSATEFLPCDILLAPACSPWEDVACEGHCLTVEGKSAKHTWTPRVAAQSQGAVSRCSAPACAKSFEEIATEGPRMLLASPAEFLPSVGNLLQLPLQVGAPLPVKHSAESEASTECSGSRPSTRSSSPEAFSFVCSESASSASRMSVCSDTKTSSVDGMPMLDLSDLHALEAMLRSHHRPNKGKSKPLSIERLHGISLSTVGNKLASDDWTINHFLRSNPQASAFVFSSPSRAPSSGGLTGAQVRRSEFQMRLPQDVPKAIRSLVGVPQSTRVTQVYCLCITESEVTLVQQTTSHDVMFGDSFRVQETFSWRSSADGGVEQRTWSEVEWIRSLPWTHGAIKSFIDKSTKREAKETAASLAKLLVEK